MPDAVEIAQDADGIIPEKIARECEQRRANGKPMPKVSLTIRYIDNHAVVRQTSGRCLKDYWS